MTRYIVHGHSWHVISRMDIYGMLFRDWVAVIDKRNSELVETPEFDLWAYSSPLDGVEWEVLSHYMSKSSKNSLNTYIIIIKIILLIIRVIKLKF
jgi:hypothetical protein